MTIKELKVEKQRELKAARVLKGLTQSELAAVIGVTQQAVSDWESGRRAPNKISCEALAKVFGTHEGLTDNAQFVDSMKNIPTCVLCDELRRRVGVQEIWIEPYKPFEIINDGQKEQTPINEGACRIFVVWD